MVFGESYIEAHFETSVFTLCAHGPSNTSELRNIGSVVSLMTMIDIFI